MENVTITSLILNIEPIITSADQGKKEGTLKKGQCWGKGIQLGLRNLNRIGPRTEETLGRGEESLGSGEETLRKGEETLGRGEETLSKGKETLGRNEDIFLKRNNKSKSKI